MAGKLKHAPLWLFAAWLLFTLLTWVFYGENNFWLNREIEIIRSTGLIATFFFAITMLISPLRNILHPKSRRLLPLSLRRSFGLITAVAALTHALFAWVWYYRDLPWFVPLLDTFSRYGVLALGCLAILWLTSFPRLNKRLRLKYWKHLHCLSYISLALTAAHVLLAPLSSVRLTLMAILIIICFRVIGFITPKSR